MEKTGLNFEAKEYTELEKVALRRFVGNEPASHKELEEAAPFACRVIARNILVNFTKIVRAQNLEFKELDIMYTRAFGVPELILCTPFAEVEDTQKMEEQVHLTCLEGEMISYEESFINAVSELLYQFPQRVGDFDAPVPSVNGGYPFCRWRISATEGDTEA